MRSTKPAFALAVLIAVTTSRFAGADEKFGDYPENVKAYLSSLYDENKKRFAWCEDYPGGIEAWKREAKEELELLMGLDRIENDNQDHAVVVELGELQDQGTYTRRLGTIETEPNVHIPFYLLEPKGEGPFPLAILPHGHDKRGHHSHAGVALDADHRDQIQKRNKDVAVQSVERGFIAIAPATRGLGTDGVPDVGGRHGERDCRSQVLHCFLAGRTAIGERVWDMKQILDWATKLPQADSERVLMMGNSGGGMVTLYASACDNRISVAVPSCSFTSVTSSSGYIFHCDCNLIPGMLTWGGLDEVAGLTAPRYLLAVNGREDSLHSSDAIDAAVSGASSIYSAAGVPDRFDHKWGEGGHQFYPDLMWPFVLASLKEG